MNKANFARMASMRTPCATKPTMDQCSLWREREATGLSLAAVPGGHLPQRNQAKPNTLISSGTRHSDIRTDIRESLTSGNRFCPAGSACESVGHPKNQLLCHIPVTIPLYRSPFLRNSCPQDGRGVLSRTVQPNKMEVLEYDGARAGARAAEERPGSSGRLAGWAN